MSRITQTGKADFEAFVKEVMDDGQAVGLAVAVVGPDGQSLYEKCFGLRDRGLGLAVDSDTVFGLASVTKSFTCLAIMQLWQRGVIDVNAPVSRYLPYFDGRGVTVAQLMYHSGGYFPLPRILVGDVACALGLNQQTDGDFAYSAAIADEGARQVARRLDSQTQFCGRPGENFSYCNDGYALLSAIIKDCGGKATYSDYLAENILSPLGMDTSCCDFLADSLGNVSKLYKLDGGTMAESSDFTDNAFALMGGGGMKSTLNDMKKYISMHLNCGKTAHGGAVAGEYFLRQMNVARIENGLNTWYGYGLKTRPMDDLRIIEHGGSLTGVSSHIIFSYEAGAGAVVLCNTSGVSVGLIADAAMKMLRGREINPTETDFLPCRWSDAKLDAVCGEYASGEGVRAAIRRQGDGLILEQSGKTKEAMPVNPDTLCVKGRFASQLVKVWTDENGAVWGIGLGSRIIPRA